MNRPRSCWPALALCLLLGVACGRGKGEAPAEGRAAAAEASVPTLDPRLTAGKLAELAFVPIDAEAIVRVDLADVAARSPQPAESLKAFDFLLRAQQPAAWQVLSSAGITVGRDLTTMYLVLGARVAATGKAASKTPDAFLIAGLGPFDAVAVKRLVGALKKTGAAIESRDGVDVFVWKRPSGGAVGANEPPPAAGRFGDAAIGVLPGLVVFGAPQLVRRVLEVRAGKAKDVRHGLLAAELLAVDSSATVWGAAHPPEGADRGYLPTVMPGLLGGHFSTALAAPGRDLDGMFLLRADFASPAQATAFRDELTQLLSYADLLGGQTPLGATFSHMRKNTKLSVEGKTVVAAASL